MGQRGIKSLKRAPLGTVSRALDDLAEERGWSRYRLALEMYQLGFRGRAAKAARGKAPDRASKKQLSDREKLSARDAVNRALKGDVAPSVELLRYAAAALEVGVDQVLAPTAGRMVGPLIEAMYGRVRAEFGDSKAVKVARALASSEKRAYFAALKTTLAGTCSHGLYRAKYFQFARAVADAAWPLVKDGPAAAGGAPEWLQDASVRFTRTLYDLRAADGPDELGALVGRALGHLGMLERTFRYLPGVRPLPAVRGEIAEFARASAVARWDYGRWAERELMAFAVREVMVETVTAGGGGKGKRS